MGRKLQIANSIAGKGILKKGGTLAIATGVGYGIVTGDILGAGAIAGPGVVARFNDKVLGGARKFGEWLRSEPQPNHPAVAKFIDPRLVDEVKEVEHPAVRKLVAALDL